ncbi:hypothetical protein VHEMI05859 [[Torrubiella] hemipterigena]|uniref:Uncharacterized protein n=1 Tax=[Torrubiella] hemipterigena TaxID=1531966 RepID=A0A0A1THP5_9HYPO|nr:hypothetical protein VHEMI05859 [[Torrubiella] hemipterigena]
MHYEPGILVAALAIACLAVDFDWNTIIPSKQLQYHPCYEGKQCARLILPLDWKDSNNSDTVAIAILKVPAAVAEDDPSFGGPILINPGGPGGSGTIFANYAGTRFQDLIDIPGKKRYEIIGFDTRGSGESTPLVNCFPGKTGVSRAVPEVQWTAAGTPENDMALKYELAQAKIAYLRCEAANGRLLSFVNTPSIARDMVSIIDELARIRSNTTVRRDNTTDPTPRLQYYGISYGTEL